MDESPPNIIYSETSTEESNVQEDFPHQKKVEKWDPSDEFSVHHTMRRLSIQHEIALNRNFNKTEIVFRNRGLPVPQESLHSAAGKDAFDLRNLKNSLPSTSASEGRKEIFWRQNRPNYKKYQAFQHCSLSSYTPKLGPMLKKLQAIEETSSVSNSMKDDINEAVMRCSLMKAQRCRSFRKSGSLSSHVERWCSYSELLKKTVSEEQRSTCKELYKSLQHSAVLNPELVRFPHPVSAEMPLGDRQEDKRKESFKEAMLKCSLLRADTLSPQKRMYSQDPPSELEEEPSSDEQVRKEIRDVLVGNAIQHCVHLGQEPISLPNLCPVSVEMPFDDQQVEKGDKKQDSDQLSIRFPPLLTPSQDQGQCSSWDSRRNCAIEFQCPDVWVPLNSPNKKGDACLYHSRAMKKEHYKEQGQNRHMIRLAHLQSKLCPQSKLRALNSQKMNMDRSEKKRRAYLLDLLNSSKEDDYLHLQSMMKIKNMLRNMKESAKNIGCIPPSSAKLDKVVPD